METDEPSKTNEERLKDLKEKWRLREIPNGPRRTPRRGIYLMISELVPAVLGIALPIRVGFSYVIELVAIVLTVFVVIFLFMLQIFAGYEVLNITVLHLRRAEILHTGRKKVR